MGTITKMSPRRRTVLRRLGSGLVPGLLLLAGACGMDMGVAPRIVDRPAAEEFGFGPRVSGSGLYEAKLEPLESVRIGRMLTMRLEARDAAGRGVDGAVITVDGGMPQHGHGLPTRPRVTRSHGGGVYDLEGLRFNMGGWWVLELRIEAAAGVDTVVFHLDI